jgi:YHS domain-containing protein
MKKVVARCKCCDTEILESCQLAGFTEEIDGKIYTFCCQTCAKQYKPEKTK